MKLKCHNTVFVVQFPIRLFDNLNLKFIKPFEVTTECDQSLNNESNKSDFKPNEFLLENQLLLWRLFQSFFKYPNNKTDPDRKRFSEKILGPRSRTIPIALTEPGAKQFSNSRTKNRSVKKPVTFRHSKSCSKACPRPNSWLCRSWCSSSRPKVRKIPCPCPSPLQGSFRQQFRIRP